MIDLNDINIYDWSELFWLDYEIKINFESLLRATNDQDKIVIERLSVFELSKDKDNMLNGDF